MLIYADPINGYESGSFWDAGDQYDSFLSQTFGYLLFLGHISVLYKTKGRISGR